MAYYEEGVYEADFVDAYVEEDEDKDGNPRMSMVTVWQLTERPKERPVRISCWLTSDAAKKFWKRIGHELKFNKDFSAPDFEVKHAKIRNTHREYNGNEYDNWMFDFIKSGEKARPEMTALDSLTADMYGEKADKGDVPF